MVEKIQNEGIIAFIYNNEDLFNDAGRESAYMTKNVSAESGVALDEYSLSDDERALYDICLDKTVINIYDVISKIGAGFDTAAAIDGKEGTFVKLSVNDNDAYNENTLSLVDKTIAECLTYGTLAEFYSTNANTVLQKMAQEKYAGTLLSLNQRLFQLKKKNISSLL